VTHPPHPIPSSEEGPERLSRHDLRGRKVDRDSFRDLKRIPIVLLLDGVVGSYNQGAIFRLADAFLLEKVHFCHADIRPGHRRFSKAARGTFKWVPYAEGESTLEVISAYKSRGYQVVVVEQCLSAQPVWKTSFKWPLCLVLGAELSGVNEEIVRVADLVVELPTMGMANSLNVSMSAGMLVHAAYAQLQIETTSSPL
jgi:23S rRNA (guanosine2251-2'-O)-methyltransferase